MILRSTQGGRGYLKGWWLPWGPFRGGPEGRPGWSGGSSGSKAGDIWFDAGRPIAFLEEPTTPLIVVFTVIQTARPSQAEPISCRREGVCNWFIRQGIRLSAFTMI